MPQTYNTPGVYIEETSKMPPTIPQVATAVPVFMGYTEKSDSTVLNVPTKIKSLADYEAIFGGPQLPKIELSVSTKKVKEVEIKYIESVKKFETPLCQMYYAIQMYFANGGGPCYINSIGAYPELNNEVILSIPDDAITKAIDAFEEEDEITLLVFPDATSYSETNYKEVYKRALTHCGDLKDRFTIIDTYGSTNAETDSGNFRAAISSENLMYGAAYYPHLTTSIKYQYDISAATFCEGEETLAKDNVTSGLQKEAEALLNNYLVTLPPSSALAGVYARVDRDSGVWKAPASVGLNMVIKPALKISNDTQDGLNVHETGKSINAIRSFAGRGTLVWGARTLDGNSNEWRYIPVRRLFNMLEESIQKACLQFLFEANNANTWVRVRGMIENFLNTQWRNGALAGAKPEEAFYVRVGDGVIQNGDIEKGIMRVEIGIAAVRPAEFIILNFTHKMQHA